MQETDTTGEVTRILSELGNGQNDAADKLLPLVYDQLKAIARVRMNQERPGHTLQATALVHEAWVRLVGPRKIDWSGRGHFYLSAAEAMRRILIDHARARGASKRGGDWKRAAASVADLAASDQFGDFLALDDALSRLEGQDQRAAEVVRLRFYAGLSIEDTARALDVSPRTVRREWTYARTCLLQTLQDEATIDRSKE